MMQQLREPMAMESAAHEGPRSAVPPLVRELEETLTSYLQVGGVWGCNYKKGEEGRGCPLLAPPCSSRSQ